jgi:hypothetical protein
MGNKNREVVERDCNIIKGLWAKGVPDRSIKETLKLTDKQWRHRLGKIAVDDDITSKAVTWYKYQLVKYSRLRELNEIRDALAGAVKEVKDDEGNVTGYVGVENNLGLLRLRAEIVRTMSQIDEEVLKMQQSLGLVHKEAEEFAGSITVITSIPQPGQQLTPAQQAMLKKAEDESKERGKKNGIS